MLDDGAKERFYRETEQRLRRIVNSVRRKYPGAAVDADATDDLHELWYRLVEKQGTVPATANREAFLSLAYRAACNLLIDRIRKATSRHCDRLATEMLNGLPVSRSHRGPLTAQVMTEEQRSLEAAVAHLSDDELSVFFPVMVLGRQQSDVFKELGLAESTGRDRLNRACSKIDRHINRGGTDA